MQKSVWTKGLVIGIIGLFIGTSFSVMGLNIYKSDNTDLKAPYRIYGYVRLKDTKEPLEGVHFYTEASPRISVYTDSNGYYELKFLFPLYSTKIFIQKSGYIFREDLGDDTYGPRISFITTQLTEDIPERQCDLAASKRKDITITNFIQKFSKMYPILWELQKL